MYTCNTCGSHNVEALHWIDMNSGEVQSAGDEVGEYYCRDCDSHTDVNNEDADGADLDTDNITAHKTEKPENKN